MDRHAADAFLALIDSGKAGIIAADALCLGVGIVLRHHEVVHVTDQQAHGIAELYLPCKVGLQLAHDGLALVGKSHHRIGEGGEGNLVHVLINCGAKLHRLSNITKRPNTDNFRSISHISR